MSTPVLRDYQLAAVEECRRLIATGKRAPLVVLPTGGGKTTIGGELARLNDEHGSTLWLAHRRELLTQASARLVALGVRRFACRTVQELLSSGERPNASLVVFDEAPHFLASEWGTLPAVYANATRVGLTATPERSDGVGLAGAFDCIVVAATTRELIARGFLVPCEVVRPARYVSALAAHPVDAWRAHASGRRTILFAANVRAGEEYVAGFVACGVRSALITGEMPVGRRDAILDDYRSGRISVLVNVYILTEGFDDPATEVVLLARGCGSAGTYLQMAGRALRPSPATGKSSALLIDLRGVSHVHGDPDEDRTYSLDGRGIRRGAEMPEGRFCEVCGSTLEESGVCVDCGFAREGAAVPPVRLSPLAKFARFRHDDDVQRADRLRRWIGDARARGYKVGWAFGKFRAVYGAPPSASVRALVARGAA